MSTVDRSVQPASPGRLSPGRAFGQLYRKDLEALQFTLVLFTLLIAAWEVFLLTRVPVWERGLPFALSFVPLAFLPLWLVWDAIQSYRSEWQSGTIHFLLAAPLPGWVPAASKLAAVMTSFTVQVAATVAGSLAIVATGRGLPASVGSSLSAVPTGTLVRLVASLAGGYWFWGLATVVLFQAASAASHLASRWRFLTLIGATVVGWWLLWRLGGLGHFLFGWVPDVGVPLFSIGPDGSHVIPDALLIDSGPVLGWLVGLGLLFAVTAWLLEHALEVA